MFPEPPLLTLPRLSPEACWEGVPAVALADVVTGKPPEQGTLVQAAWDGRELRFRFAMDDSRVSATLTARDAPLYTEEVVEVFLDPVGDLAGYFEIEVNPRNAVLDLVIRRNRSGLLKETRWQCEGLRSEAGLRPGGWFAELALPLASLTPDLPVAGARWRAQLCRIDRPAGRERELSAWSPTGQPLFHVPERFGTLIFG